jgi:hypothetical protein
MINTIKSEYDHLFHSTIPSQERWSWNINSWMYNQSEHLP